MAGFLRPDGAIIGALKRLWARATAQTPQFRVGIYESALLTLGITALLALSLWLSVFKLTPELLQAFAAVGASVVIAYSLMSVWLLNESLRRHGKDGSAWLAGNLAGFGTWSVLGFVIALVSSGAIEKDSDGVWPSLVAGFTCTESSSTRYRTTPPPA